VSRPLIDFVRTDALPEREVRVPGADRACSVRELSRDLDTGARSLVLDLPPGWSRISNAALDHDEEWFVLAGDLEDDGDELWRYSYVFRAAGRPRHMTRTQSGARVLAFERPATSGYHPERTSRLSTWRA
jgi:hypothetical protein